MNLVNGNLCNISLSLLLILVLDFTFIFSHDANAATFNVPGDFATIQEAIDSPGTMNGDTINIAAGTHVEAFVHITKELIIQGQGIGVTIIDPSSIGGFTVVLYTDTDNIIIRDLTIQNADQAIRFELAGGTIDNTDIVRVEMLDNASRGIEIHNQTTVTNLFIDECNFENTNHGLRIASSGHLDGAGIEDSTFTGNVIGFYMANDGNTSTMSNVDFMRNTFMDHTTSAIYFEEGQNIMITNNDFVDNRRDIQILKWYNPSIPVSNVIITDNTMTGTTNAVFAIFNADNGGRTRFSNVRFLQNNASTANGSAVFAGAHRTGGLSAGGTGWNTVRIRNNCFTGITTAGNAVRFFIPTGVTPTQALAGASIDVTRNWWGTASPLVIGTLMQIPAITDYTPFRTTDICTTISALQVEPGVAGVVNDFSSVDGTPNGDVAFIWGTREGEVEASNICRKLEAGIIRPKVFGMATANEKGHANLSVDISRKFSGTTIKYQAVDMETCTASEVMEETF